MMKENDIAQGLKNKYFAANLVVLWLSLLIYRTNHYYLNFLSQRTQEIILGLAVGYTVIGFVYYRLSRETEPSHAYVGIAAIERWVKAARRYISELGKGVNRQVETISKAEKNSLLFLLLKFLFLPMMIEFMVANWASLVERWGQHSGAPSLYRV